MQPILLIDDAIPFIKGVFEPKAEVRYLAASAFTPEAVKAVDALIIRTRTRCDARLLAGSRVRFVATATIGFDHIDAKFCAKNGITWSNAAGCNASSVAQYVASVLAVYARENHSSLEGKTLGVVGVGHVGKQVCRVAEMFGMRLLLNDPIRQRNEHSSAFVPLETIANRVDIMTFHTPLTHGGEYPTYHLADATFFAQCSRKPLIINTSRGGVVDEEALKNALHEGRVAACAIDCWENEPFVDADLMRLSMVATPHIAGYSADGKASATTMSVRAVSRFFGLGLDDFKVQTLSPKECWTCRRGELSERLLANYDVLADDHRLRANPDCFESLRSHYPIRREVDWVVAP